MKKASFIFLAVFLTANVFATGNSLQALQIPPRQSGAVGGAEFMARITPMSLADREAAIFEEISNGNIPDALRQTYRITRTMRDRNGVEHDVVLELLPDFLAIGSDDDFYRIPMGPMTAQRLATLFGATLPTRKISNLAWEFAEIKMAPQPIPWNAANVTVPVFMEHNRMVETQRATFGRPLSTSIAGHKKDVVISNRLYTDSLLANGNRRKFIFGWHQLNGTPIQPLSGVHDILYVDYSHGIRLVNQEMLLNGEIVQVRDILRDSIKYVLLSDETEIMRITEYGGAIYPPSPPPPPPPPDAVTSFAVIPDGATGVRVLLNFGVDADYRVFYGNDVNNLAQTATVDARSPFITGLTENQLYYFSVQRFNEHGESALSRRLAATPTNRENFALVVVGFNRNIAGNHGMFVRQHAEALVALDKLVASATNYGVIAELVNINDFPFVSWMLGEESTVDVTLNATERNIVINYLEAGGFLYISGSEIGWDLGRAGSAQNAVAFFRDYLKSIFVATSPGVGAQPSGLSRSAVVLPDAGFGNDNFTFSFADGTEPTTSVNFPDVLLPAEGAVGFLRYILTAGGSHNVNYGGIAYAGTFGNSATPARVVVMGIPFEAIVPAAARTEIMRRILNFDGVPTNVVNPTVSNSQVFRTLNGVRIELETLSKVKIFDIAGKLIHRIKTDTTFEHPLMRGVYLVKVDGEVTKVVK